VIGRVLGSYRIISPIGEGGMGAVYLAEHPIIRKQAAVKVLRPEISGNAEMLDRFFNEARATARLDDPAFVEVFDCGVAEGSAFIVMEYVRGESLAARLARLGHFPVGEAVALGRKIARAVGLAHAHGIVHRDLKPDNIIISAGEPEEGIKILDFGIAKLSTVSATSPWEGPRTRTGVMMGTPQYMSPEQCRGAAVDERADIYSLACILHALVVGEPPFAGASDADVLSAQLHQAVVPLRARQPSAPPALDALVSRMLAKSPGERPRSMNEVGAALAAVAEAMTSAAQAPTVALAGREAASPGALEGHTISPTSGDGTSERRRSPLWAVVAGAALAAVAAGVVIAMGAHRRLDARPVDVVVEPAPVAVPRSEPSATPEPAPSAEAPAMVPAAVQVRVGSEPAGATVSEPGGWVLGTTPLVTSLPRRPGAIELLIEKPGYPPRRVRVPGDADSERTVPLGRRRPRPVDPDEWRKL